MPSLSLPGSEGPFGRKESFPKPFLRIRGIASRCLGDGLAPVKRPAYRWDNRIGTFPEPIYSLSRRETTARRVSNSSIAWIRFG